MCSKALLSNAECTDSVLDGDKLGASQSIIQSENQFLVQRSSRPSALCAILLCLNLILSFFFCLFKQMLFLLSFLLLSAVYCSFSEKRPILIKCARLTEPFPHRLPRWQPVVSVACGGGPRPRRAPPANARVASPLCGVWTPPPRRRPRPTPASTRSAPT